MIRFSVSMPRTWTIISGSMKLVPQWLRMIPLTCDPSNLLRGHVRSTSPIVFTTSMFLPSAARNNASTNEAGFATSRVDRPLRHAERVVAWRGSVDDLARKPEAAQGAVRPQLRGWWQ